MATDAVYIGIDLGGTSAKAGVVKGDDLVRTASVRINAEGAERVAAEIRASSNIVIFGMAYSFLGAHWGWWRRSHAFSASIPR